MFKSNKKGFGDAVSTLIMFIAVVSVTVGLVVVFQNYVTDTQQSYVSQNEIVSGKLKTSITITNIFFNDTTNITYIYVKNIGETKLKTQLLDLFINEKFYEEFDVYDPEDLSTTIDVLELQQTIAIAKQINLTAGSHEVKIRTQYGVGDEESFNI